MMHILAISDGRPGHFKKTEALLRHLEISDRNTVDWIEVPIRGWASRTLLRALIGNAPGAIRGVLAKIFFRKLCLGSSKPQLIVSSGANTLFANSLLAAYFRCPNVFIGSLRSYRAHLFWRVITVDPSLKGHPRFCYVPFVLTGLDASKVSEETQQLQKLLGATDSRLWALLVGGDGAGYRFSEVDILNLVRLLQAVNRNIGVRWLITTSRRTGPAVEELLARSLDPTAIALFSPWSKTGSVGYHGILGLAERIVCTDDSQMMIAEAIATGRPVTSLYPGTGRPRSNLLLEQYCSRGLLVRQALQNAQLDSIESPSGDRLSGEGLQDVLEDLVGEIRLATKTR